MIQLRVCEDLESLSLAAATWLATQMQETVNHRGRCSLVLAGGHTPRRMYELLAERFGTAVPWPQVDLFWADERYVPHDHPQSNYRMAQRSLLDRVVVPSENVHPIPTHHAYPERAALEYEQLLREYFHGRAPEFGVMLLGLAADGHVASLFPHQPALHEQSRWVIAATVPADPPQRITMTFPVVNASVHVAFLVAGQAKAAGVARALQPGSDIEEVPAAGVAPKSGDVTWWLDAAAAALIRPAGR